MKKYLLYITTLIASFTVASCLEDPYLDGCPEETSVPVQLMLSFADNAPTSRDVSSSDTDLDYTTDPQSAMTQDDVYILVFNKDKTKLLYLVDDLTLGVVQNDGYYTRALNGTMKSTTGGENVSLVVLANLKNQGINIGTSTVKEYLLSDACMGKSAEAIYKNLVYQYDTDDDANTTEPWNIDNRRIPMWGEITNIAVPNNGVTVDCYLYRAVAKVQVWVNDKKGIEGVVITGITLININESGYCVSWNQTPSLDEAIQYTDVTIPENLSANTSISFTGLSVTDAFSDQIYLPEQLNTADVLDADGNVTTAGNSVELVVNYTLNGTVQEPITCKFIDYDNFDKIIRNHSYIFNLVKNDTDMELIITINNWNYRDVTYDNTPLTK